MLKTQISQRDELLIQRCIDDELTPEQTYQLLSRLDELSDGWKSLACGFIEDRSVGKALRSEFISPNTTSVLGDLETQEFHAPLIRPSTLPKPTIPSALATGSPGSQPIVGPPGSRVTRQRMSFWWAHPMTSMSLCAAIAFVSGMLLPDIAQHDAPQVAENSVRSGGSTPVVPGGLAGNGSSSPRRPNPQGHLSLPLNSADGSSTLEIPMYENFDEFNPYTGSSRQHLPVDQNDRRNLLDDLDRGKLRAIRVPVDENRDALIFYHDQLINHPVQ